MSDEYVTASGDVVPVLAGASPPSSATFTAPPGGQVAAIDAQIAAYRDDPARRWSDEELSTYHGLWQQRAAALAGTDAVADQMEADLRVDEQGIREVGPEGATAGLEPWAVSPDAVALVQQAPEHLQAEVREVLQAGTQLAQHTAAPSAEEADAILREAWGAQYGDKLAAAQFVFSLLTPAQRAVLEAERPGGRGQLGNSPELLDALARLGERAMQSPLSEYWLARRQAFLREDLTE